jgi:hypothetical protein
MRLPVLCLLLFLRFAANAQTDSLSATKEPLKLLSWKDPHSPTKASIYSAVIPGLGQVYNQKYWKVPLVYASLGAATYMMLDQRAQMKKLNTRFKQAYALNPDTSIDINLISERDNFRRMRDFGILAISAIYVLQIADAAVDAHFFKFNINQSLSARIAPSTSHLLTLNYRF